MNPSGLEQTHLAKSSGKSLSFRRDLSLGSDDWNMQTILKIGTIIYIVYGIGIGTIAGNGKITKMKS